MTTTLAPEAPITPTTSSNQRVSRVIVVDDDRNEHLLMMLAAESARVPMEFTFVDSGSDLLSTLADASTLDDLPDMIILDLRMPGMDGHRTLEHIQSHPVFCRVPVMVYTTSARQQDEAQAYRCGATWFETKAAEFDGLIELVDRVGDFTAYDWRTSYRADAPAAWWAARLAALRSDTKADVEDELMHLMSTEA